MTDRKHSNVPPLRHAVASAIAVTVLLPMWAGPASAGTTDSGAVQTECPVMIGNAIKDDMFTVYQGKKVFFCCEKCKAEFAKAPEKYLSRLPQFAAVGSSGGHNDDHEHGLAALAVLIVPMGITTLVLVAATVTLGVFRRFKPRPMLKIHKKCGVAALAAGAIHATLVMLLH